MACGRKQSMPGWRPWAPRDFGRLARPGGSGPLAKLCTRWGTICVWICVLTTHTRSWSRGCFGCTWSAMGREDWVTWSMRIRISGRGAKGLRPRSSRWCPVAGQGFCMGQKLMHRKIHLNIRKNLFAVQWLLTGTDCPERLWRLPHWRYSGIVWIRCRVL